MKKICLILCLMAGAACWYIPAGAQEEPAADAGKRLFEKHCAVCHPGGGNLVNPDKTLRTRHLAANGLSTADSLVKYMLNPGKGMPRLVHEDREITREQAASSASYTIETFNGQ